MERDLRDLGYEMKRHLDPGERIIWAGVPKQGLMLTSKDVFLIPFSLMWGGFAIFWETLVLAGGGFGYFMAIFGIPFVLIGLYLIFGRFFYDAAVRKNTTYVLTNNRIIIKSGILNKNIKSLDLRSLTNVTVDENANGRGTILLASEAAYTGMFRGTGWPGVNSKMSPAFFNIPEARNVYKKILEAQQALKNDHI